MVVIAYLPCKVLYIVLAVAVMTDLLNKPISFWLSLMMNPGRGLKRLSRWTSN